MHRKITAKYLICLGIGLLAFNCSVRKTDKEKGFETIKTDYSESSKVLVNQEETSTSHSIIERSDFSNWYNFEYQPLFDQNGQIIPLIIEQTKNGQTEKLIISGASVSGGQNQSKNKEENRTETINRYISNITYKSDITYKSHINYKTVTKERLSFGPQSIYIICLLGITIVCAVLAFTGHWRWIQNVFKIMIRFFSNK